MRIILYSIDGKGGIDIAKALEVLHNAGISASDGGVRTDGGETVGMILLGDENVMTDALEALENAGIRAAAA